ncbi:hypothetical protein [Clostridium sp. Cult3]|uniref:hypothetical protein n=1 Tax=Clostridium sp. Cult3 TaxID=2079004 RepID=UPI001F2B0748|nr:hypothetical protein [Clostridium sp. Cult3]
MCQGFGFYNYPGNTWLFGGMLIFRVLFAIGLLVLGYKLVMHFINNRTSAN